MSSKNASRMANLGSSARQGEAAPRGPIPSRRSPAALRRRTLRSGTRLRQLLASYPEGRLGDRAALALGNVLLRRESYTEALDSLARAARGAVAPRYAGLLRVRAIVGGGLSELYPEAMEEAKSLLTEEGELV